MAGCRKIMDSNICRPFFFFFFYYYYHNHRTNKKGRFWTTSAPSENRKFTRELYHWEKLTKENQEALSVSLLLSEISFWSLIQKVRVLELTPKGRRAKRRRANPNKACFEGALERERGNQRERERERDGKAIAVTDYTLNRYTITFGFGDGDLISTSNGSHLLKCLVHYHAHPTSLLKFSVQFHAHPTVLKCLVEYHGVTIELIPYPILYIYIL